MKVEELQPGDTINGMLIYDKVMPRWGCEDKEVEVPLAMPLPLKKNSKNSKRERAPIGYIEWGGNYYPLINGYTFPKNTELDEARYKVVKKK